MHRRRKRVINIDTCVCLFSSSEDGRLRGATLSNSLEALKCVKSGSEQDISMETKEGEEYRCHNVKMSAHLWWVTAKRDEKPPQSGGRPCGWI